MYPNNTGALRWFRKNNGVLFICLMLLLVKLASIVVYWTAPDDIVDFILGPGNEDAVDYTNYLRESYSGGVVHALGYRYDSVYYVEIARNGYYHEKYFAFPPGFPLLIRLVSFTGLSDVFSGVLISNLFHFLSIILFYSIALTYLKKEHALLATVLFAFFPYNMASGTLAYSDSTFMAFSLLSWIMLERKKYGWCGAMVFIASLIRFQGVILYLIYSLLLVWRIRLRLSVDSIKSLITLNIPMIFFLYWILVFIPTSGSSYNLIQETYWDGGFNYPFSSLEYIIENMPILGHNLFFIAFISIAGLLAYSIKPDFALYSLILLLFYSSFTEIKVGAISRYLGTIWPAYLYAGWKFGGTLKAYRLHYYVVVLFVFISVYFLLLHMNWIFVF